MITVRQAVPDSAFILIAVITQPRDLEIARLLGWYRIPLRSAPKILAVDYLALYQTGAFGEPERWRIRYLAAVRGHELATRSQLLRDEPEHPRANEEYYKLQIGPLEVVNPPILANNWRRLTFLYTTGSRFNRAVTLKDLIVKHEDRLVLWRGLRERVLSQPSYKTDPLPEHLDQLDALLLAMLGDRSTVKETHLQYEVD